MRVVGSVRPGPGSRVDCDRPLRVVCRDCDHLEFWKCDTYGCEFCAPAKRRRLERLVHDGSLHQSDTGLRGYFLTLTAPGTDDHLRWYQGRRPASRPVCECHRHGQTLGMWNAGESACWNRLRTALSRTGVFQFVGAVETQKRGALHRHVVLFTDQVLDHAEVQRQAMSAGYGCVLDIEYLDSPKKAAKYLSKYVPKASVDRAVVPWSVQVIDTETGEITEDGKRPTYRLWSSSRHWGVTMKEIRSVAAAQARQRAMYLRELDELLASSSNPESRSAAQSAPADNGDDPPG